MTSQVEWIEDEAGFLALEREWEPLAAVAALPFARHEWFRAMWESYPGLEPVVLALREGGALRGVLPLRRRGRALHALATDHTPGFVPPAADDEALRRLLEEAVDATPELVLPLPARSSALRLLRETTALRRGRAFWAEPWLRSPYADTTLPWEEYRLRLSRNSRKEAERRGRRLAEAGGTVEALVLPGDVRSELEEGLRLEAAGWKGRRGTSILSSAEDAAFYRRAAELFHARGALAFSRVRLDGRLVGWEYDLLDFGRAWTLKVAIDEDVKQYAPGILIAYDDIRRAGELGLETYEMLGDAEPWKTRFSWEVREQVIARSFARRPAPVGAMAYRRWVRPQLKALYKRLPGR